MFHPWPLEQLGVALVRVHCAVSLCWLINFGYSVFKQSNWWSLWSSLISAPTPQGLTKAETIQVKGNDQIVHIVHYCLHRLCWSSRHYAEYPFWICYLDLHIVIYVLSAGCPEEEGLWIQVHSEQLYHCSQSNEWVLPQTKVTGYMLTLFSKAE